MKIIGPLIKGKFVERTNRFMTLIELDNKIVESHLPDPGRLLELLIPNAKVWLRPAPIGNQRRTKYSTVMVEQNGKLISLDTTLPNRFFKEEFQQLPFFASWQINRTEYQIGNHRIDFLLMDPEGNKVYTEIKSVTFVEKEIAKFPDAITERGRKHIELLYSLKQDRKRSQIIFICQHPDAQSFEPMWDRDPAFAAALVKAYDSGVEIKCITTCITLKEMKFSREIPVNLTPPNES